MLTDFVKAAVPEDEALKAELKAEQAKLFAVQTRIKEAKLPVMVIFAVPAFLLPSIATE